MHLPPARAVREKGELQHFHHQTSKLNAPLQQGSPVTFCRTLCSVTGEESSLRGRGGDGSSFTPQGPSRSVLEGGHSPLHSLLLHYRVFIDCLPYGRHWARSWGPAHKIKVSTDINERFTQMSVDTMGWKVCRVCLCVKVRGVVREAWAWAAGQRGQRRRLQVPAGGWEGDCPTSSARRYRGLRASFWLGRWHSFSQLRRFPFNMTGTSTSGRYSPRVHIELLNEYSLKWESWLRHLGQQLKDA